jgi:arylsulfatase A-like enzyme
LVGGETVRESESARVRPNVLVVCIDSLRADRLSPYGGDATTSRQLAQFAVEGVVFERAFSVASWTKPAVASLLTGLYPSQHGLIASHDGRADLLPDGTVTLAETLRDAGYRTGAFVENVHLQRALSALDQGFETYEEEVGSARQIVEAFAAWLTKDDPRPTFAYLHLLEPHWPYVPLSPPVGVTLPPDATLTRAQWGLDGSRWPLLRDAVNAGRLRVTAGETAALYSLYRGEIFDVDRVLGTLMEVLRRRSLLDETLIVIVADHGEGFLEHGRLDHGYGPYDELLRIPLIVRLPNGANGGRRVVEQVQITDVAPTIVDYLDLVTPARGGRSLRRAIEGAKPGIDLDSIAEEVHGSSTTAALRDARYKYVRTEDAEGVAPISSPPPAPEDLRAGLRVRLEGVAAHEAVVVDEIKLIAAGDEDCEITAPLSSGSVAEGAVIDVIGLRGDLSDVDADDLRKLRNAVRDDTPGVVWGRLEGEVRDGNFAVEEIQPHQAAILELEIEGVIEAVEHAAVGTELRLCGRRVLVDRKAAWKDFVSSVPAPQDVATAAPRSTEIVIREELYDLARDPREQSSIAAREAKTVAELRRRLAHRRSELATGVSPGRGASVELDRKIRERLEALGYTE